MIRLSASIYAALWVLGWEARVTRPDGRTCPPQVRVRITFGTVQDDASSRLYPDTTLGESSSARHPHTRLPRYVPTPESSANPASSAQAVFYPSRAPRGELALTHTKSPSPRFQPHSRTETCIRTLTTTAFLTPARPDQAQALADVRCTVFGRRTQDHGTASLLMRRVRICRARGPSMSQSSSWAGAGRDLKAST